MSRSWVCLRFPSFELILLPIPNTRLLFAVGIVTSAMALPFVPLSIIDSAVCPSELAFAMFHIIFVLALVGHFATWRRPHHLPAAREFAILKVAFVKSPVTPALLSKAVLDIVLPLAIILASSGLPQTMALAFAIDHLACVCGAIAIQDSLARFVLKSVPSFTIGASSRTPRFVTAATVVLDIIEVWKIWVLYANRILWSVAVQVMVAIAGPRLNRALGFAADLLR
mmetsp:Transcript_48845/g.90106  ORF Transcript_48845/g.90106 Transcript_48845/m.90106 type:complete len:226 (+) Transcript_48845:135-812(+)